MLEFKKRQPPPGAQPGTLVIDADAPATRIRLIRYTAEAARDEEDVAVERLATELDGNESAWIDVQGFGDGSTIRRIGEIFGLHSLAVEDVVNVPQRPKAEAYAKQLLIIARMVRLVGPLELDIEQVSIVVGASYVITFQERPGDVLDPVRWRLQGDKGRYLRQERSDHLGYTILDTIIDGYYPALEALGDQIEELEDAIINQPTPQLLRELNWTRTMLAELRRSLWPQREAVNALIRDPNPLISDDVRLYLRDVYDHCVQTVEVMEGYRETVAGLVNTYLSSMANRTNDIMRVLTIMASIFIPQTLLVGIYGMNFEYMPELHVWWAYPLCWAVMVVMAAGMLVYFRRKGWIAAASAERRPRRKERRRSRKQAVRSA